MWRINLSNKFRQTWGWMLVLIVGVVMPVGAEYRIENLDSRVMVNRDMSVTITETFRVSPDGSGVLRTIPTSDSAGRPLGVVVKSLTNENGTAETFGSEMSGTGVKVTGGPEAGTRTLTYTLTGALKSGTTLNFEYAPTDENWRVGRSRVTLYSQWAKIMEAGCVTDAPGDLPCVQEAQDATQVRFSATGANMRLSVGLDPYGQLVVPTPTGTQGKDSTTNLENTDGKSISGLVKGLGLIALVGVGVVGGVWAFKKKKQTGKKMGK